MMQLVVEIPEVVRRCLMTRMVVRRFSPEGCRYLGCDIGWRMEKGFVVLHHWDKELRLCVGSTAEVSDDFWKRTGMPWLERFHVGLRIPVITASTIGKDREVAWRLDPGTRVNPSRRGMD